MSLTPRELNKLTVLQLKAICKERNLTGYSKLSKDRIIQKLVGGIPCKNPAPLALSSKPPIQHSGGVLQGRDETNHNLTASGTIQRDSNTHRSTLPDVMETTPVRSSTSHSNSSKPQSNAAIAAPTVFKRPLSPPMFFKSSRKQKAELVSITKGKLETLGGKKPSILVDLESPALSDSRAKINHNDRPSVPSTGASGLNPTTEHKLPVSKRFVPLVIKHMPDPTIVKTSTAIPKHVANQESRTLISHFDFPSTAPLELALITIPPPLSQRKWVDRFSIVLGGITSKELYICSQVSRSFRYAAYLSAASILIRTFPGRRLNDQFEKYPSTVTNMWPYLQRRQLELQSRQELFARSFLGRLVKENYAIAEHLWSSPDHEKQIVIALRCLLSYIFFTISVGSSVTSLFTYGKILDVQPVANSEIWQIAWSKSPGAPSETKFVLEQTGEVIGHRSESREVSGGGSLRADWSAFIAKRLDEPRRQHPAILSYLDWTNKEEYEYGISKQWLKNIEAEGHVGDAKKILAHRYVLACVVGNSISGRCMSSTEMAQEFNGNTSNTPTVPQRTPRVHLFLPCHHHVESVHFTAGKGVALHPALAVVQTPNREYYILRDNGMQVGCEEDGVAMVWMRVLGCSQLGT